MPERGLDPKLAAALDRVAAQDAPAILAEARAEARARVRELLTEALVERLLDQAAPGRPERSQPRRVEPEAPRAAPAEIVYVYGVVDGRGQGDAPRTPPGIGGRPVRFLGRGDLWAAVSPVPADEFGDDVLKRQLNDLTWLEQTAREHESVVEALLDAGPVVPMRLCTIFLDEGRVGSMLEREAPQLRRALERVRDAEELGVKVIAGPPAADETDGGEELPTAASEGQAYFRGRQRERDRAEQRREQLTAWSAEVHEELAGAALDDCLNPPSSRELESYDGEMVLNGAYLVATADVPAFRRRVAALAERHRPHGLDMRLTGPWPPYNFTASLGAL
jgi:Gas vesicle synthesis protein GvpL/GvpF